MPLKLYLFILLLSITFCSSSPSNHGVKELAINLQINADTNFPPIISSLEVSIENNLINVGYNISDLEDETVDIELIILKDDGSKYLILEDYVDGDYGLDVRVGDSKSLQWRYKDDPEFQHLSGTSFRLELIADDNFVENISDLINLVDSTNLVNDIKNLQGVRHHRVNKQTLEQTRLYIRGNLEAHKVSIENQAFPGSVDTGINIIGTVNGSDSTNSFYVIDGHYDTVTTTPGADDNASGTAGMLEAMRVLSQFNFEKGVKFIGFDMEELGLLGSKHYVKTLTEDTKIEGVINFEMIGYTCKGNPECINFPNADSSIYNISSSFSNTLSDAFIAIGNRYVPQLKITSASDDGDPNFRRSDHAPFWDLGIDALFITDGANFRTPHYHRDSDKLETLDIDFMTNIVKTAIGTIAELAVYNHTGSAISKK